MKEHGRGYSLKNLILYFLRLGATGFGGPAALVSYMERDLVEDRRWITKDQYVEGLALSQLSPGPLAAQLAIYIGWAKAGAFGGALAGMAFVAPSFLICVALAVAYLHFGGLPWIQGLFYSVGAAVIGIIINSAFKLLKKTVGKDKVLLGIWIVSAAVTAWTEAEMLWVFLLGGMLSLILRTPPKIKKRALSVTALFPAAMLSGLHGPATINTLWDITTYFTKAGAFVFGSGLAIIPFLHSGVVQEFRWLNDRQFIDAVAVAMITPGPVVITVAFIGYLVAGVVGASIAAAATFLPCYFFTVIPAPYYSRFAKNRQIKGFIEGVTAAAVGAIGGATVVLGKRAIIDPPTACIAFVALLLVVKAKVPDPIVILGAGVLGLALQALGIAPLAR